MQRVLWSIVAAGSLVCGNVDAQRFYAHPPTVYHHYHSTTAIARSGYGHAGYGHAGYGHVSRRYPIYGYSTVGSIAPYGLGYVNDPYQSGSFKVPDLLDDPLFIEQHRHESRFPGRRRRW